MAPSNSETLLRDVLAIDRTALANERTLLAYGRTFFALLAVAGTVVHFVTSWWGLVVGLLLGMSGVTIFVVGIWRYRTIRTHLSAAREALKLRGDLSVDG